MATRALAFEFLLAGLRDPDTGEPLNGGSVEFYEVGTSTPKNVWTEEAKTNAYTSYTLDTNGVAELYGDGSYKVVVKDSGGATEYTFTEVKMQSPLFNIRVTSSATDTATPDDDCIVCDCSSGNITLNLEAADTFDRPLFVKKTGASNTLTIDPDGSETVDGSSTVAITIENHGFWLIPIASTDSWIKMNDVAASLDGLTASIAEINTACDGITATATEINNGCDGLTATAAEINAICDQSNLDLTWTSPTSNYPQLLLKNTNTDANPPYLRLRKESTGSAADNDEIGAIQFEGFDSGDNLTEFVRILGTSQDVTDADEAGRIIFYVMMDGTVRNILDLQGYNGSVNQGQVIVNNAAEDVDFIVKDDAGNDAFKIQSSDGAVIINGVVDAGSGTTTRIGPAGTFVNHSSGAPVIIDTSFDIDSNIGSSFESVGPTGSGATNIWTALDEVPADATHIYIHFGGSYCDTGSASSSAVASLNARKNGTSLIAGGYSQIGGARTYCDGSGNGAAMFRPSGSGIIPVSTSIMFDLAFATNFTNNAVTMFLVGWDFNP